MRDGHHLSLSLGRALWEDLLRAALPVTVVEGEFDLVRNARQLAGQVAASAPRLGVRERISGLLERAPDAGQRQTLERVRARVRRSWDKRRAGVSRRIDDVVKVEGTWRVEIDDMGTHLRYGRQQVQADAFVRGTAEGTLWLLRRNVELPFKLTKRVGASVTLGDIRYDPGHEAVIGSLRDLAVHLGDDAVLQLLSRLAEYLLDQQLDQVNPVPILRRRQVEDMVAPMGGAFRTQMGVESLSLEIDEHDMTLRVRFGFTQPQLEDRGGADRDW